MHRFPLLAFAAACVATLGTAAEDGAERLRLFDDFSPGWRGRWREQSLFAQPTRYDVVTDAGRPVLHAASRSANAGLVRELKRPAPAEARLHWRWKVRATLAGNTRERERAGDDYAARVFVVFETSLNPFRTRAINYVWAATEKAGAVYASPYAKNVAIVVLRSGDAEAGAWQAERRDVLADYRAYFGEPATTIGAVAVSVDTDNTQGEAEAWFDDLVLETKPPGAAGKRP
jgi:hypothetical protein